MSPDEKMLENGWNMTTRRRLRLRVQKEMIMCEMKRGETKTTRLLAGEVCGEHEHRIEVRDSLAQQLIKVGATVLVWKGRHHSGKRHQKKTATPGSNSFGIDILGTVPGRDELEWLDVTIRPSTSPKLSTQIP